MEQLLFMHVDGGEDRGSLDQVDALVDELSVYAEDEHPDIAITNSKEMSLAVDYRGYMVYVHFVEGSYEYSYGPYWATPRGREDIHRIARGLASLEPLDVDADVLEWRPGEGPMDPS